MLWLLWWTECMGVEQRATAQPGRRHLRWGPQSLGRSSFTNGKMTGKQFRVKKKFRTFKQRQECVQGHFVFVPHWHAVSSHQLRYLLKEWGARWSCLIAEWIHRVLWSSGERWEQSADRCWLKPWEQVSFQVRTVNTKKSMWPRTEHPPKGKTKANARKRSWRREPEEIITEAKSRVLPRDQSYMLALDSLCEANSGVSSGKLRAVSEGMGLGLRGDCPVKDQRRHRAQPSEVALITC